MRAATARMAVVGVLSDGGWWYGLDIARAAGLRSGRLYPALTTLEDEGRIESRWMPNPFSVKHPRRREYRLNPSPAASGSKEDDRG